MFAGVPDTFGSKHRVRGGLDGRGEVSGGGLGELWGSWESFGDPRWGSRTLGILGGSPGGAQVALGIPGEAMGAPPWLLRPPKGHPSDPQVSPSTPKWPPTFPQASQQSPGGGPGLPKAPLDAPEGAPGEPRASHGEPRGRFFDFWKTSYFLRNTVHFEAGGIRGAPRGSLSGP